MQCTKLPQSACQALDQMSRNFLWESSKTRRKTHLIRWEVVIQPWGRGGLGLHRIEGRSKALFGKLVWRTPKEDKPWARVMRSNIWALRQWAQGPVTLSIELPNGPASSLFPLIKAASCGRKPPPKALDVLVSNSYGPAYHIGWLVQWDRLRDELFVHILI